MIWWNSRTRSTLQLFDLQGLVVRGRDPAIGMAGRPGARWGSNPFGEAFTKALQGGADVERIEMDVEQAEGVAMGEGRVQ